MVLVLSRRLLEPVADLLLAGAQSVAQRPDAQLWVAGDGDDYVRLLHDTVATHDLGDSVSFLGFVSGDEKQRVLREAWAFALPSHQENFGVAVLEAEAARLPVVISGAVQLRPFVETNDLGVVVDRTDSSDIAAGLSTVLADADGRWRVAELGRRLFGTPFLWSGWASSWERCTRRPLMLLNCDEPNLLGSSVLSQ